MKVKEQYDDLLNSGDLLEMFPHLSGIWTKDKLEFIKIYEQNQEIIKNEDY